MNVKQKLSGLRGQFWTCQRSIYPMIGRHGVAECGAKIGVMARGSTMAKCLTTIASQMMGVDGGCLAKACLHQLILSSWHV